MTDAEPKVVCERCREPIDVNDPATVQTFEQVPAASYGEPLAVADGLRAAFHPGCYDPNDPRYRLVTEADA